MNNKIEDLGKAGIIVADWDITLPYPYKTMTTDYSTWITYISRKPVPRNTPITDIRYWKPITRLSQELQLDYQNFKNDVNAKVQSLAILIGDIQKQINDMNTKIESFVATGGSGEALSNLYGESEVLGITQKTLTETITGIYKLIGDTIGVDMGDVEISITPDAFYKNDNAIVNVSAVADYGLFDVVRVYLNNQLALEKTAVQMFSENLTVSDTVTIKVEAVLLGKTYTKTKTVQMATDFFIGAGDSYEDVYKPEYSKPYDGNPQGSWQVEVAQGQRIIIILPTADVPKIEQIEMNDVNIPMQTSTFGIYTAYTSLNVYNAGTYQIDINY